MKSLITRKEIAHIIGLNRKTIWKDISEANLDIPQRKRLNNADVKKIKDFYGIEDEETPPNSDADFKASNRK